jgi:hypothetical protein
MNKLTRYTTVKLLAIVILPAVCFGNGYNEISRFAMPAMFILAGILLIPVTVVTSAVIYHVSRKISGRKGNFGYVFFFSVLSGELGLIISYFIEAATSHSGYTGYHYLLYPWLIGGLSLAGAITAFILSGNKSK